MRTLTLYLTVFLCGSGVTLLAQTTDEIELTRSVIQTEKKAIVAANMQFTEEESRAFWPVYNEYQNDLRKVNDKFVKLIEDYAESYLTLTNDEADDLLKESLDIEKERHELKESYMKKFKKELSSKLVARYYQVENKLETIINYEIAATIPLAR